MIQLPSWLSGPRISALKKAAEHWWQQVRRWIDWPLTQLDPQTCTLGILHLIAWQRAIDRFDNEPEWLYRRRVQFAYVNAVDAGSVAGLKRIFERLELGGIAIKEREPDRDWDVVKVFLSDRTFSDNHPLLRVLLSLYGRTCRRYEFTLITQTSLTVSALDFDNEAITLIAQ